MADARLDARRAGILAAMGVEVYRLRAHDAPALQPIEAPDAANDMVRVLVICAKGDRNESRLTRLFAQLPRAFAVDASAIASCEADANGELVAPPPATAYLVLGSAMARSLGAHLSTLQQQQSVIAVTAESAQLPGGAVGKRALWQALKPIARVLHGGRA
jgi:hypothetical protein